MKNELMVTPLYQRRPRRAERRKQTLRAHARSESVAHVAEKRVSGMKHKSHGRAPREVFVPLVRKALKLFRQAGLHREPRE